MKDYNQIELQAQPLLLFDALDEIRLFLPKDRPDFCVGLLYDDGTGRKRQEMVSIAALPDWFDKKANFTRDLWISQHVFCPGKNSRETKYVRLLTMAHVDLDVYDLPEGSWATGRSPEEMARSFMVICDIEDIPRPSYIVFSGRGLQAKWLFERPIPSKALSRWEALQEELQAKLQTYGADSAAIDASRVLRVVRSSNSRSGQIVRVVEATTEEDGSITRYGFDYLAECILPKARPQKTVSLSRQEKKRTPAARCDHVIKSNIPKEFALQSLYDGRLDDLKKLLTIRGGIEEGQRMTFLMLYMTTVALAGRVTLKTFKSTADQIAQEIDPKWSPDLRDLNTVFKKFRLHLSGERKEFRGRKLPHLYTHKTQTIIRLLAISEEEQQQLRTLVSGQIKRDRAQEAQRLARRAAGVQPREEYLSRAAARRERAIALRRKGYTIRAIAAEMSLSVGTIGGYLKGVEKGNAATSKQAKKGCSKCGCHSGLAKPTGGRRLVGGAFFSPRNPLIASSGGGSGEGCPPPRGVSQGVDPPGVHDARDWPRLKTPKP